MVYPQAVHTVYVITTSDIWAKIAAISGLVSGILVALIGGTATYIIAKRQRAAEEGRSGRQLAVLRVQTVQGFIGSLGSEDEREKAAALLAINALGDADLASKLAELYGGEGSIAALSRVAARSQGAEVAQAQASLAVLFDSLREGVLFVGSGEKAQASGFVVAPNRVVTTAHAVHPGTPISVRSRNGVETSAEVLTLDPDQDLAVLIADTSNLPQLRLESRSEQRLPGDEIVVVGYGRGVEEVQVGQVEGLRMGSSPGILARLTAQPGFSGAPAFNQQASVIGIVQRYNRASLSTVLIPAETIREFLRESGVENI